MKHLALLVLLGACSSEAPHVTVDAGDTADAAGPRQMEQCTRDRDCSDDVFCNGVEVCAPGAGADERGCRAATEPACLASQRCDERAAKCTTECELTGDADGDGARAAECGGDDCNDADGRRYPGNTEVCDREDHDEDCDPSTFGYRDVDHDGYPDALCCNEGIDGMRCGNDCNDALGAAHPSEAESCDTIDNDCDGTIDETVLETFHRDGDGDGFGAIDGETTLACAASDGFVANATDCDDANANRNPGAPEVCDALDNDCDGAFDGPSEDDDADGFADYACGGDDCYDSDDPVAALYHPGAPETCNGWDRDCDGRQADDDGDGFIASTDTCTGGQLEHLPRTDCDDSRNTAHPGATDTCNGADDDCDGAIDEGAAATCELSGALAACEAGVCVTASCLTGGRYLECNADRTDGCEDLQQSGHHCGACGIECPFGCDGHGGCDPVVAFERGRASCAATASGRLYCWGENRDGQLGLLPDRRPRTQPTRVPLDGVVDVSTSANLTCALTSSRDVYCWGEYAGAMPPTKLFTNVVDLPRMNGWTTCVLRDGGELCCYTTYDDLTEAPHCQPTSFVDIEVSYGELCGHHADRSIECWQYHDSETPSPSTVLPTPAGTFGELAIGARQACAIRDSDGAVLCWRMTTDAAAAAPSVVPLEGVNHLAARYDTACATTTSGEVYCWGGDEPVPGGHPGGMVQRVEGVTDAAFARPECVLHRDGGLSCWGSLFWGEPDLPVTRVRVP